MTEFQSKVLAALVKTSYGSNLVDLAVAVNSSRLAVYSAVISLEKQELAGLYREDGEHGLLWAYANKGKIGTSDGEH